MRLLAWPSAVEAISDVVAHENTEEVDEKASLDAHNRNEATTRPLSPHRLPLARLLADRKIS